VICGKCGFDRWDGVSSHWHQGRESSRVNCFGPRTVKPIVGAKIPYIGILENGHQPPKKRGRPSKADIAARTLDAMEAAGEIQRGSTLPVPNPLARKRGRPRKGQSPSGHDTADTHRTRAASTAGRSRNRGT
jgi:hypothetical protein